MNRRVKSGQVSTGMVVRVVFNYLNTDSSSGPHFQRAFFRVSAVSGVATVAKFCMKHRYYDTSSKNCHVCFVVCGAGQSTIDFTFSGSDPLAVDDMSQVF